MSIFLKIEIDNQDYIIKPMNCPFHIMIYKNRGRSYRDFPLRWAELSTVYRYERSGVLHGLLRVRGFTQDDAQTALDRFAEKWDKKYTTISKSWRNRWSEVIPFMKFSPAIRKAVYTTNAIESLNYNLQRNLKTRQSFPNDEAAMKLVFMILRRISKRWTMPIRNWGEALNQFAIIYGDRVPL